MHFSLDLITSWEPILDIDGKLSVCAKYIDGGGVAGYIEFLMLQSDNFTIVQDELEEEILFQGLWGQVQVVIGMLQSSLAQSQVQLFMTMSCT